MNVKTNEAVLQKTGNPSKLIGILEIVFCLKV